MKNQSEGTTRKEFLMGTAAAGTAAMVATLGFNRLAQAEEGDELITQTAEFKMDTEKQEEARAVLAELVAGVEANEPDVLAYICHQGIEDPSVVYFFEVYKNEAALAAHGTTPHMAKFRPNFGTLLNAPLKITKFDRIKGFAR